MPAPALPLPLDSHSARSLDGTVIRFHASPASRPDAPWIVLANGLGGPHVAWRHLLAYLGERYRFVTWDYRGLYGSARPSPDEAAGYRMERHVDDLDAIRAALGIERAALVGWSMGVQVVLEATRRHPELAHSLVLLNGTAGRPLDTLTRVPRTGALVPHAVDALRATSSLMSRVSRRAARQPEFLRLLKRAGLMGRTMREDEFAELSHGFAQLDMDAFFRNLRALGDHDASPVLSRLTQPVLVITGDQDGFTPRGVAQQMARRIPRAEILVVRGGTHYTAIEFPELVNLRIERFLVDHGY